MKATTKILRKPSPTRSLFPGRRGVGLGGDGTPQVEVQAPDEIRLPETDGQTETLRRPRAALADVSVRARIYQQFRRGVSLDVLASQFGRSRVGLQRVINEMRAERILETELGYIHHESFDDPSCREAILGPMPARSGTLSDRRRDVPEGTPPYLASLYEVPLLSREQEMHLFRKMNYLKFQAKHLRDRLDPKHAKSAELDAIERLQEQALELKNEIIRANLRLVVSIAKRHVGHTDEFFELVSDGNMSLIHAVEKFDFSRGNKFSTYASWAVMNNFARTIPKEKHRRDRFVTGHDEMFAAAADVRADEYESESAHSRNREVVTGMLDRLGDRERRILVSRYGLEGATEQTLEQLGRELGVTKERIRQIEARAEQKLRKIVEEEALEAAG
jgi:RNA polymerase primary sigma factor